MLGAAAVMSRAAASFASLAFPSAQGDGLLDTLRGAADGRAPKTQQDGCGEDTASLPLTSHRSVILGRAQRGRESSESHVSATSQLSDPATSLSLATAFSVLWFVLAASVALVLDWATAAAITAVILFITLYVRIMSRRQFGGMSGDLAGFLIQLAELGAVAALVLLEKAEVLL
jgi:hypothetical protein